MAGPLTARALRSPIPVSPLRLRWPVPGPITSATASAEHASTAVWTSTRRSGRRSAPPARVRSSGRVGVTAAGDTPSSSPTAPVCARWSPTSHAWTFESVSGAYRRASRPLRHDRHLVRPTRPPRGAAPRRLRRPAVGSSLRSQDTAHRERRMVTRGVAIGRGVARHGGALVPRAAGAAVRAPALASAGVAGFPDDRLGPAATGLDASRRRRLVAQSEREAAPGDAHRPCGCARRRLDDDALVRRAPKRRRPGHRAAAGRSAEPDLRDRRACVAARARPPRRPGAGRLRDTGGDATEDPLEPRHLGRPPVRRASSRRHQLPVDGPDWVTWNPVTDSVPNAPGPPVRQRAHDQRVPLGPRRLPARAPRRSSRPGRRHQLAQRRRMEQHVSHQNGLDVDVYYPRRDG